MAIELKKVTYKNIIKNIDCEFEEGKIYTILTSNEREKEILGKLLSGLINGYTGEIINNYPKDKISYVPYNYRDILIGGTVKDELMIPIRHCKEETINKRLNLVFKMLDLDKNIRYLNINDISDGEKKLVEVAYALMNNPKLIVLNEPILDLDDCYKNKIIKLLKKIAKDYNKTIIILTSDILFAYQVCDKYLLLKKGKIIDSSSKKNILNITDKLMSSSLPIPKIIEFINIANSKKNIPLAMTYDIKELMKDIYRNAR